MLVSHNWLKEYIGDSIPSVEEIEKLLSFHAFEIEGIEAKGNDSVLDVDVLPNRSSDCLCHRGIAREIATLTNTPLTNDPLKKEVELLKTESITVDIEDGEMCPRFTASIISGIEVKESPEWLKERLEAIGQRSINNIVDATNYVMFAIGQPIHAYDADLFTQVDGKWQFGVRLAKSGEVVSLIAESSKQRGKDKTENEDRNIVLKGTELLIVDNSSNTPIGLAGVKGGRYAGVHEGTTRIIVEAANFEPIQTRKTARGLGIVIDASKRFENEPSRELPPYAQQEVVDLIIKIAGGECEGMVDVYLEKKENKEVTVRPSSVNSLLGLELAENEMEAILVRAGIVTKKKDSNFVCIGPFERTDLNIEEDFIEEIGRVYGYENIASVVPESVPLKEFNARHYYSEKVRDALIGLGFSEVITSTFRKKDEVHLLNALASDKEYLRSSLRKNIAEVLDRNAGFTDLLGTSDTRVFEIGTVFEKTGDSVAEHVALCIGVRTKVGGYSGKEDKLIESIFTELETDLDIAINRSSEKGVAEIDFSEVIESLPTPSSYDSVNVAKEIVYKPFSRYPFIVRDIALLVPKGADRDNEVIPVIEKSAGTLLVGRPLFFDEYVPSEGERKSFAFRLVFQSKEKTLTDDEVNEIMEGVYSAVNEKGWEVR